METLQINNHPIRIISSHVILELNATGRAIFTIHCTTPITQSPLQYHIDSTPIYHGHIQKIQLIKPNLYRILTREITTILEHPTPLSLRNQTIQQILKQIQTQTHINITTPKNAPYLTQKLPHFHNLGNAILALDTIARETKIQYPTYNLLPNNTLYFGPYYHSPFNQTITIPENLISERSPISATIQTIPHLRPGMQIKIKNQPPLIIEKIELNHTTSRLHFSTNPWNY